jgi:hypothetical protein
VPIEAGDAELRTGLSEVRELLEKVPGAGTPIPAHPGPLKLCGSGDSVAWIGLMPTKGVRNG